MIWLFSTAIIMLLAAIIVYMSNKKLAARLYESTYCAAHSIPDTTYRIERSFNKYDSSKYQVMKGRKSVSPKYSLLSAAKRSMNELELLDGIPITKFSEEQ